MTLKFAKEYGLECNDAEWRKFIQIEIDGGAKIARQAEKVWIYHQNKDDELWSAYFPTPGRAVKFAAALNKTRRPLRLIKKDLDMDWAMRVKERDNFVCALCGWQGDKTKDPNSPGKKDVLTAHHWLKTKSRAGLARWARPCGVTVHFAEHIHTLHENPCWVDLERIYSFVSATEGEEAIHLTLSQINQPATEELVRQLWRMREYRHHHKNYERGTFEKACMNLLSLQRRIQNESHK